MIGIILYFDRVLFFRHENPSVHLLVSFLVVRFFGKASKLASQRREIVTLPEITATYFFCRSCTPAEPTIFPFALLQHTLFLTGEKSNFSVAKKFVVKEALKLRASVNESFYHLSSGKENVCPVVKPHLLLF